MNGENVLVHLVLQFTNVMSTHVRTMVLSHAEAVHTGSDSDIHAGTHICTYMYIHYILTNVEQTVHPNLPSVHEV